MPVSKSGATAHSNVIALTATIILAAAAPRPASADESHAFQIAAAEASTAVREFAQQSGLQVMASADALADKKLKPVTGEHTTEDALKIMLADSGLKHEYVGERGIAITAAGESKPSPLAIPQISATDAKGDQKPSFWDRFRVAQVDQGSPVSDRPAGAARSDTPVKLEEVLVTAQKREERLQEVPVPLSALDAASLAANSDVRLQDYYTKIPGLTIVPGASSSTYGVVSIRGITTGGSTNPTVGITVDDVPYGSSTALGGGTAIPDIDPSDLTRVEVLRGPQGTLYGASSLGGLIKFVTQEPSVDRLSGRAEAGVTSVRNSDDPGYNVRASINVPLSDTAAIRASGFSRRDAGYLDNPTTGADGVNTQTVRGGRLSALWAPSERLKFKISGLYQDFDGDSNNGVNPTLSGLQQTFGRGTGYNGGTIQAYSATVSAKLGSGELTSLSGYNIREFYNSDDFTGAYGPSIESAYGVAGAAITTDQKNEKFTQELRYAVPLGTKVDLLIGGFYTHENSPAFQDIVGIDQATGAAVAVGYHSTFPTAYKEYAAFADLTFYITDRFDIQLGGRGSSIKQATRSSVTIAPLFGSTTPMITEETRSDAEPFTYLLTPRFRVSDDLMVYARIASGYRAGGSNVQSCTFYGTFPCAFAPDKTKNYEVGAKGSFLDHRLSLDGSLYYIDWKGIQLQARDPASRLFYSTNASAAKSQGVELSLSARPTDGLDITAWAAWSDAELTKAFPAVSPVSGGSGDRLPYSARFSSTVAVDQSFPLAAFTGFVGGSVSYVGSRVGVFKSAGLARQEMPSYARTDLHAGVRNDTWTVNLYANNVFDKRGVLQGPVDTFPPVYLYIQPRTLGLSVSRSF